MSRNAFLRASFSRQSSSVRRTAGETPDGSASRSAVALEHARERARDVLAEERGLARQHLVEHAAERPDVGAPVDGFAARLLGAHVRRRAEHHAGLGHRGRRQRGRLRPVVARGSSALAMPKSSTFTVPSGVSLMFAGFRSRCTMPRSCAASSAAAICVAMSSASLDGSGALRDALGERLAVDELHDERGARRRCARARRSARCSGGSARRASSASRCEARERAFASVEERLGQHLERDVALRARYRVRDRPRPCRRRRAAPRFRRNRIASRDQGHRTTLNLGLDAGTRVVGAASPARNGGGGRAGLERRSGTG